MLEQQVTKWSPPPAGFYRVNVDARVLVGKGIGLGVANPDL